MKRNKVKLGVKPLRNLVWLAIGIFLLSIAPAPTFAAITCGDTNFICVVTGTNTTSARFIDGNTYIINGAVTFQNSGVDLNIEPGAVLKFVPTTGSLTVTSSARINANGNSSKTIKLTSCRDQTMGANTAFYPSCSGVAMDNDYATAISITSTSGMEPYDSLSFMSIKFATTGIALAEYLESIHDINFSRFGRRTTSGNAISIATSASGTEIYNNSFDINSNGTSAGMNPIQISSDYNGDIHDNNFNMRLASYGVYISAGNFSGNFYDNNFTGRASYGILASTAGTFSSAIYSNTFDINGNAANYVGVYRSRGFTGRINDNNFTLNLSSYGFYTTGAGNLDANIYGNSFRGISLIRGISINNAGTANTEIYSNVFDINGVTASYGYAIQIANDFTGSVHDNNFHLKQYAYGLYTSGATFSANISDNNFGIDRGYAIYYNSPISYGGDINSNIFYSETPRTASYIGTVIGYALYQAHTGGTFPGSMCNNTFHTFLNTELVYSAGIFSGSFCRNNLLDANLTVPYLFYSGSNFSGSIIDNNFSNMLGRYTNAIYFYFAESFSGEIARNTFFDFNNHNATNYLIRLAGSPTTGNIRDNNFTKFTGTAAFYAVAYTGTGTCYTNIEDNNVVNFYNNVTFYYQSGGTVAGGIRRNQFKDFNTTTSYYVLYTNGVFSGAISDNNFFNLYNARPWYQLTSGSFTGDFNNNTINTAYFTSANQMIYIYGFFSGNFYGNKISNITNATGVYSNATFSGNIYNNLFVKNNSATEFIMHASSSAFSGSVYNNTFTNFNLAAAYGVRNTGNFTGSVKRNLFAYGRNGLSGTFVGSVSHNAFLSISTIGGSANQHVGDQNTLTGFTRNPFDSNNLDRNFLLNTDLNGGTKLVDRGDISSTQYFMKRTTSARNKLDTGTIDIGYHYDQNAIYVAVQSPNGGETISGVQAIDFNVESGFGQASEISASIAYSASPSGGTQILGGALNGFSCSAGPVYTCSYSWDSSDVTDGNYFIVLSSTYSGSTAQDASDRNFLVLSIPKFGLKTYLGTKPRGFFTRGQDVNIIVYTTAASPSINIIDSQTGNTLVSNAPMLPAGASSDMNGYSYSYKVDGNEGWHDARISGKTFEHIFYVTRAWQSRFVDDLGTPVPFSTQLTLTEPGLIQRWFVPIEVPIDFNYFSSPSGIRLTDFNGDTYVEIPSQVYDVNYSGQKAASGKVVFMESFDVGETRDIFINYSRQPNARQYYPDMNLSFVDSNYVVENSLMKVEVDLNLGGAVSGIYSKKGTNTNLGGSIPLVLSPESKSGIYTYSSYSIASPSHSLDVNGGIFSKVRVWARVGQMDYNTTYYFYARQPYYVTDMNIKPASTQNWSYYYDDYKVIDSNKFIRFSYNSGESVTNYDLNSTGAGSTLSFGDANFWAAYNRNTSDALGSMFVNRASTVSGSISSKLYDEAEYDYWTRQSYSGIVTESDRLNSRIGHSVFNPWNRLGDMNRDFITLKYGVTRSLGGTATSDSNAPSFVDWNATPSDANDLADLNIWASISDNLQVDYVDINISGPNVNIQARQEYGDANIVAYYVLDSNLVNAGTFDVNFRATDIARNSQLKSWQVSVSDLTAPQAWKVALTPDDNASIDPGTSIRFDVNVNEYTGISFVNLLIRWYYDQNSTWSDWNSISMPLSAQVSDYNYNYSMEYSIPSDLNKHFQYKISAEDTAGNDLNSDANGFYAYIDYTWEMIPASFGVKTGALDTNISIGDINITNTGDAQIAFTISSNWDPAKNIFFNSEPANSPYELTVLAGTTSSISSTVTSKTTERSDSLTITATPRNPAATPISGTSTGTIVSLAGGPFMLVEITEYVSSALQGATNKGFTAKVTNKGNQDANNVVLSWSLPANWTITSGSASASQPLLQIDESLYNAIVVTVGENAQEGTATLTATATPDGNELKTRSESVNVVVIEVVTEQAPSCSDGVQNQGETGADCGGPCLPCAAGGSTGGGTSGASGSSGGGGGSIFTTEEQVKTFFQTVEKFELVRGRDQAFKVRIKNPFPDKDLRDMHADVSGLLSKYLSIENPDIPVLGPNEEGFLTVKIIAPKYFEPGKHDLAFTITGVLSAKKKLKTVDVPFTFKSNVTLFIRDITKEEATGMISKAKSEIADLAEMGLNVTEMRNLIEEAGINMEANEYDMAAASANSVLDLGKIAREAVKELQSLDELISKSEAEKLDTSKTKRMRGLAKLALDRGDFQNAVEVLKEAHLTHSLETKGAFNYGYFIMQNSVQLSTALLFAISFFISGVITLKRFILKNRIKSLKSEEKLLLDLIKDAQIQCFVTGKISMAEYQETITQYEKKFTGAVEKIIEAENELINQLNLKSRSTKLADERDRLMNELKDVQEQYFKKGIIETRVYEAKIGNLTKRLNEIEKNITYHEAIVSIRKKTGFFSIFWRAYYKIFK